MKPTAAQILQRCKDIVEGKHSQPEPFAIKKTGNTRWSVYYPTGALMADWYQDEAGGSATAIFARILGMDSEPAPAPEVVLEWEEDEYGRPSAKYNENVAGICFQIGILWFAYVEISGMQSLPMTPGQFDLEDAQKWCADTIKAIVTPNARQ